VTIAVVGGTGAEGSGRDAQRAVETAARLREQIAGTGAPDRLIEITGAENQAACRAADIVVLTVPFESQAEMLKHLKPALRTGQILVDATVPLAASVGGRATRTIGVWQGSAAQQAAELIPEGVAVVAAFHNTSAEVLRGAEPVDCDVIVCSDDREAGIKVRALARKILGVRAIDGGRLENARIVEQITALLIGMNIRHKGHSGIRITGLPPTAYEV
jgi:hypothetical protein